MSTPDPGSQLTIGVVVRSQMDRMCHAMLAQAQCLGDRKNVTLLIQDEEYLDILRPWTERAEGSRAFTMNDPEACSIAVLSNPRAKCNSSISTGSSAGLTKASAASTLEATQE